MRDRIEALVRRGARFRGAVLAASGLAACGGEVQVGDAMDGAGNIPACECFSGSSDLSLGVLFWPEPGYLVGEVLEDPSEFEHRISTETHYRSFVNVARDYDITQVGDEEAEQILRFRTESDTEELSTWESVVSSASSWADGHYNVDLEFEAVVAEEARPDNGVLELDSSANTLTIEWEYPRTGDKLEAVILLD